MLTSFAYCIEFHFACFTVNWMSHFLCTLFGCTLLGKELVKFLENSLLFVISPCLVGKESANENISCIHLPYYSLSTFEQKNSSILWNLTVNLMECWTRSCRGFRYSTCQLLSCSLSAIFISDKDSFMISFLSRKRQLLSRK